MERSVGYLKVQKIVGISMVISRSLTTKVGFAELHCLSNYSFLSGASYPEELVEAAAQKGYRAIALTDECTYSGLVKAHMAAKKHAIKFIVGSEFGHMKN